MCGTLVIIQIGLVRVRIVYRMEVVKDGTRQAKPSAVIVTKKAEKMRKAVHTTKM